MAEPDMDRRAVARELAGAGAVTPRRGARFEHARFIVGSPGAGTARPDVCEVTAVRSSTVWYRNESGMRFRIDVSELPRVVGRWIEEESCG